MFSNDLLDGLDTGFAIQKHVYSKNVKMAETHYHRHYEILHITKSARILKINENNYYLDKNVIAVIAPFVPHLTISCDDIPQERVLINFTGEFVRDSIKIPAIDLLSGFNPMSPVVPCSEFNNKLSFIESELDSRAHLTQPTDKTAIAIYLSELLLLIYENNAIFNDDSDIMEIIKYIEENYNEIITLSVLEKKFYMSRYTISRKIREYTGISLPQYINTIRLIYAKKYIKGGMNITETAMRCGFGSLSDFDRVFKSEVGMTPSEYKKVN